MSKQASGMRGLNIDMMQQTCDQKMLTELAKLRSHADAATLSLQQNGVHGPDSATCLEVERLRQQRDLAQTENEVLKGQIEELARILEREKNETIVAQNSEKKALSESMIATGQLRVMREGLMNSTHDFHHHDTARIGGANDDDLLRSQCTALKERLADVEMSRYRQREKSESMRLELGKAKWEILQERETQKQQQHRIQKLEGELFRLKSEAIQLQEQAHEQRKTLDETRGRLKMKEEHISKHRLECERLKGQLNEVKVQAHLASLKTTADGALAERKGEWEHSEQMSRLQHELNAQTKAVEDAVEAKTIVQAALEEKESELGESKRKHDNLKESLGEELKQAEDENTRLHANVKTLKSRVDELDAVLSVEKEDKASARRQIQTLTTQRDEAKRHASEVAENLDQVRGELRQTKMDLENLEGQVAQLQKQNYKDEKQQSENTAREVSKLRQELALANAIIAEKDDLLLTLRTQHHESCEALRTEREQYNAAQRVGARMQQNYGQALAEIEHLQDQNVNSPHKHDRLHAGSAYTAPEYAPSRSRSSSPIKSPERTHLSCGIGLTLAPRILHDGTLRCKVVGINADGGAFEAGKTHNVCTCAHMHSLSRARARAPSLSLAHPYTRHDLRQD